MLRRAVDDLPVAKAIVDGAQAQSPAGLSDSITARLGVSPVFTFAHDAANARIRLSPMPKPAAVPTPSVPAAALADPPASTSPLPVPPDGEVAVGSLPAVEAYDVAAVLDKFAAFGVLPDVIDAAASALGRQV